MSLRLLPAMVLLCILAIISTVEAAVRPFVLAGGSAVRAEKTDLDEMLDPYTIREHGRDWEAGGGLRFIPGIPRTSSGDQGSVVLAGDGPIEMRLRFTLGGGSLPGARFSGPRSSGFSYPPRTFLVSSREKFTYSSWALGGFFSARVYRSFGISVGPKLPAPITSAISFLTNCSLGFYVGPVLQTVKYEADRAWTGPTDCADCGPAKDKATSRYGALEAGAHYTLRQFPVHPLRLEGFWIFLKFISFALAI